MACPTLKCCPVDYEHFNCACWSPSPNAGVDFTRFLAWVAKVACNFKLDLRHESLKNIVFGYICNDGLAFEQILGSGLVDCSWCLGHIINSTAPKDTTTNVGGYMFVFSSRMVEIATSLLFVCLVLKIDEQSITIWHTSFTPQHIAINLPSSFLIWPSKLT